MICLLCTKIIQLGFGGTTFQVRRSLIDHRKWVSEAEFADYFAIAPLIPDGANLYNLSLRLGHRLCRGARRRCARRRARHNLSDTNWEDNE